MKEYLNIHQSKIELPFEVPTAYFEKLPQAIQDRVRMFYGLSLEEIPKEAFFLLPQQYFAKLPQHIQAKVEPWEGSPSKADPNSSFFILPASTFEDLPAAIQARIQALDAKALPEKPQITPFEAPQDFFTGLEKSILAQTSQKEAEFNLQLPRESPFGVPENYFEQLAHTVQDRIREERSRQTRWSLPPALVLRWAGAFALLIALGIALWQLPLNPDTQAQEGKDPLPTDTTILDIQASENISLNEEPELADEIADSTQERESQVNQVFKQVIAQAPSPKPSPDLQEVPEELLLEYLDHSVKHELELAEAYALLDFVEPSQDEFWEDVLDENPKQDFILGDLSDEELNELAKLLQTKP